MSTALVFNGSDTELQINIPVPDLDGGSAADYSIVWSGASVGDGTSPIDRFIPAGRSADLNAYVIVMQQTDTITFYTTAVQSYSFVGVAAAIGGGFSFNDYHDFEIIVAGTSGVAVGSLYVDGVDTGLTTATMTNVRPSVILNRSGVASGNYKTYKLQYVGLTDRVAASNSRFYDVRGVSSGTTIPETTGNGADATVLGSYSYEIVGGDSIDIDLVNHECWQRDTNDEATVNVSGTYTGTPAAIERSIDSGAFTTIDAAPSGEVFSDSFTLTTGAHSVEYRFTNDTGISVVRSPLIVGDGIIGAGQSQISGPEVTGYEDNYQTYTDNPGGASAYMFGNDDQWKPLSDPSDSTENQVDAVSDDLIQLGNPRAGSWIVKFCDIFLNSNNIPIFYIPCPLGGSSIERWQKTSTDRVDGLNLYESMARRAGVVNGFRWVFMQQGEANAQAGTDSATYQSLYNQFINDVFADFGVKTLIIPLGDIDTSIATSYDPADVAQIRADQIVVASGNANAEITQPLTGIENNPVDGIHMVTDAALLEEATRVYESYAELEGLVSQLSINVSGIPDGNYLTYLVNSSGTAQSDTLTYSGGAATFTGVNQEVGTQITGYVVDSNATPVDGAVIVGVTS